jgi:hypothetical protein
MEMFTYPQGSITSLDMVYQIGHTKEDLVDLKKVDVKELVQQECLKGRGQSRMPYFIINSNLLLILKKLSESTDPDAYP